MPLTAFSGTWCTFKGKIKSCKTDHSWRENCLRDTTLTQCDTQDDPRL